MEQPYRLILLSIRTDRSIVFKGTEGWKHDASEVPVFETDFYNQIKKANM